MKIIAIDMDGTLLNHRSEISKVNAEAIKYAQSLGIKVVIATGRSYFDALEICKEAGVSTYIIGNNGSTLHNKDGNRVFSIKIANELVEESIKWLEENNYYYEVSTPNSIYTPINGRQIIKRELDLILSENPDDDMLDYLYAVDKQFGQQGFSFINSYKDILGKQEDILNILSFSLDKGKRKKGAEYFKNYKDFSLFLSTEYIFEMVSSRASKGLALKTFADMNNISLKDTVAIGDSHNDIPMLSVVNYSVAMGNASDEVKAICRYATKTNEQDGVAHIIYKLIDEISLQYKNA
ncbi:HAD-superfamily hydrolase [Clostridium polyendosporum]|uniref:HAD-superfamily hydrolase n=1 Tax=Clostridium polyendosporum TaxID=69208 RepID=A0A919RZX1_9CLOT|nr:Cof-type HAD-IIB family hydrolase [Clostridium polyendosporum]GIM28585.1 HAD-superfamily hydrolase [Clostridium polyendosporum]